MYKFIDGGKIFEMVLLFYGDIYDMWINFENSLNMINVNDGGVIVIFDGGEFWLSIYN